MTRKIGDTANEETNNFDGAEFIPSEEAKEAYAEFIAEVRKRQLSSSENFDKSILTYSSAGLAISLTFLKDFVPIHDASAPWLLFLSWGLFAFATVITVASFLISYEAQSEKQKIAERYYLEGDESAFNEKTKLDIAITLCNFSSGTAFVLALVCTTVFVSINLSGANNMTTKKQIGQDGMPTSLMQRVTTETVQRGTPSPALQKVPSQQSPSTPSNSNKNSGQK